MHHFELCFQESHFWGIMDGVEFLKAVGKTDPNIIRILMATIASDDLDQEIRKAGIDRFIEKPLTVASLDRIINELENYNFS